jgi:O-antigen/teichoic acid export membrane protein
VTTAVALVPVCVVSLYMEGLVGPVFGADFVPAAPMMVLQTFAVVPLLAGMTLTPVLYSLGLDRALAWWTTVGAIAFFFALALLTAAFGAMGASFAHLLFNTILSGVALILLLRATSAPTPAGAVPAATRPRRWRRPAVTQP